MNPSKDDALLQHHATSSDHTATKNTKMEAASLQHHATSSDHTATKNTKMEALPSDEPVRCKISL